MGMVKKDRIRKGTKEIYKMNYVMNAGLHTAR